MALDTLGYAVFLALLTIAGSSNYNFHRSYEDGFQSDDDMRCDLSLWGKPSEKEDRGFRLRLDTNSLLYVPEKKYNVYLEATMDHNKFEKFLITAESVNHSDSGKFELKNPALSKFSRDCPNTIEHTSLLPKMSISVTWKAPSVDSGCVLIRAAVYDRSAKLYHGGNLTLKLCQGELDETVLPEILEICGACNEASYQLTFEGLWSRQTHPKDFPPNRFETFFDGIIGASHSNEFRLWEFNTNASKGIAELADTGRTKTLERELKVQSKYIRTVIKAKGLPPRHINGKTHAIFRTDDKHHLLSLIAKFFPSPDWVVGITALELCLPNNSWATNRVVNLYSIDVGTIDGFTYKVQNKVLTMPRQAIRQISPIEDYRSPFYSESGSIQPMAKVTVIRQRVFGKSQCITTSPPPNNHRCAVTDWANDGPCNCPAAWVRQRRHYKNPNDRYRQNCKEILVRKIRCPCNEPVANGPAMKCDTTEWSSWSECSCGTNGRIAYRSRRRYYKNNISYQMCSELLWEKEDCLDAPTCSPAFNSKCAVTDWSEWSPCNATCETKMGMRLRTRLFRNHLEDTATCNVDTIEQEKCVADRNDCNGAPNHICSEPKEAGLCTGSFRRWYYNSQRRICEDFIYTGCRGNRNNFESYYACSSVCKDAIQGSFNGSPTSVSPDIVIDCKLSPWGEWSECSTTCGIAWKERRRATEVNPQNGGKRCDTKVYQRKRCRNLPPCAPRY